MYNIETLMMLHNQYFGFLQKPLLTVLIGEEREKVGKVKGVGGEAFGKSSGGGWIQLKRRKMDG